MYGSAKTREEKQVSLRFFLNQETKKVLFAEAEKDFIDILFSFLTLPLGTIARLAEQDSKMGPVKIGNLNTLYHSLERLSDDLLCSSTSKNMLLQPRNPAENYCSHLKFNIDDTQPTEYFVCSNTNPKTCTNSYLLSTDKNSKCACGCFLNRSVFLSHSFNGFAKNDVATFIITDNLIVLPFSMGHSCLPILQKFELKDCSLLAEQTVIMTSEKVLDLFKYSLPSKTPLSDFYFEKKPSQDSSSTVVPCEAFENSDIQIRLRLIIRKSNRKLVLAHAGQDFIDLLISFLAFPLGAVVKKLNQNSFLGSIDALYKGITDLDEDMYLLSKNVKNKLLDPQVAQEFKIKNQILPFQEPSSQKFYCYYHEKTYLDSILAKKFSISEELWHHKGIFKEMTLIPKSEMGHCRGFLKGPAIYMVTIDLEFAQITPISSIELLQCFKIPFDELEEKMVTIGVKECLNILKATLTSRYALMDGLRHLLEVEEEWNFF